MRTFVAVELSSQVTSALAEARDAIVARAPEWSAEKWVAPNNLHMTLAFLGDVGDKPLACLRERLATAFTSHEPFDLGVAGVSAMPPGRRHTMLWADLADSGHGAALAATLAHAAEACAITVERRRFTPHVTLVRSRRPRAIESAAVSSVSAELSRLALSMSVASVTLFASTLTPRGPVYRRLDVWELTVTQ